MLGQEGSGVGGSVGTKAMKDDEFTPSPSALGRAVLLARVA